MILKFIKIKETNSLSSEQSAFSEEADSLKIAVQACVEGETAVVEGEHIVPSELEAVHDRSCGHEPVSLVGHPIEDRGLHSKGYVCRWVGAGGRSKEEQKGKDEGQ